METGYGFGKTILFGEHFVVYGLPAIASAISNKTIAEIDSADEFTFIDERPETPGYKVKKKDEIQRQLGALKNHFKKDNVRIKLSGDLACASGVGASAALAASIARAYNQHLKLNLTDEEINDVAFLAECAGSGKASGIDNTCSVYGGFIIFEKNLPGGKNIMEKIPVDKPINIVMASSGITQTTKEVVDDVRRLKEKNPEKFGEIFIQYRSVFDEAVNALEAGDNVRLGQLMDANQKLLTEMTLSCHEIDEIISLAKDAGALGAKLTGTGRGGTVIALTPDASIQDDVLAAIQDSGYKAVKTSVGT
ncbi:MAG: mevalonate kinase [Candidatus Altiarchaeota archaeon]|nr:mevalonate kinase [Candidatus Altiarchaeota archaeon]